MKAITNFVKNTWRGFLESFLLIGACFLLIPPVQSDMSTKITFETIDWIAIGLFFMSRFLAFRRGGERLWTMLLQTAGFYLFARLLYERFELGIFT